MSNLKKAIPMLCGSCLSWSARLYTACCWESHCDTASAGFAPARASLQALVLMEAGGGRGPQSWMMMATVL